MLPVKFPAVAYRHTLLCLFIAGVLGATSACSTPGENFRRQAAEHGLATRMINHQAQPMVVFTRPVRENGPVHIYLDGDGRPQASAHRASADPTTREALILKLMARDPAAAALIGRPCYYQQDRRCRTALWTHARYGEPVIAAMARQINLQIARYSDRPIWLIGYSGGGTLAMLLATRLERIDRIVTVAANLDTAAWAVHHDQAPLSASLNPAEQPPLPVHINQLHLFGGQDRNVPAALMRGVAERQPQATVVVVPEFTHSCCWEQRWPSLMYDVSGG